jgi:diaminohydroxyphosphoribosylaminopyrimidine deaminase/5-amino-6-(5-phosphoribosylamino)uracil reductase
MDRALELARRGWGRVAPNPLVGAVVVREGEVVAEGWHARHGAAHAEAAALESAGPDARGATVYVTLEPCTHRGKTPPCAPALVEAGVGRVVVACRDPHPRAGGGVDLLRDAGIPVEVGVRGREAARLNAPFLWRHAGRGTLAVLKLALSLDGRLAEREGVRSRVTGREAGRWVHRLRAGHDAILVGSGTARVDDPRLTARGEVEPRVPPVRVVLDRRLRLPADSRLAETAREVPVWVLTGPGPAGERREALEAAGVRVLEVEPDPGGRGLDPAAVMERLAAEEVGSVLVEGGGQVAASFLHAGVLQRIHLLYAPRVYGSGGVASFPGRGSHMDGWRAVRRAPLGPDTRITLESGELRALLAEVSE